MVSKRNYNCIRHILGDENVMLYELDSFTMDPTSLLTRAMKRLSLLFRGYMNGATPKVQADIINIIKDKNITIVFIDSSLNGLLVKKIKQETKVRIISFFHNCEYSLLKQGIFRGEFVSVFRTLPAKHNESLTALYSDVSVVLNLRDKQLIKQLYQVKNIEIIPITLDDQFKSYEAHHITRVKNLLFIGSNFFPNINGANWFIKNVLPYVDCYLTIVGRDIDKAKLIHTSKLQIIPTPDDLSPFYEKADLVVVPIFEGGGMKVKVAEALMHGKIILAANEAIHGYENIPTVISCNSPEDYIEQINSYKGSSLSNESRKIYTENYSTESALGKFKNILTQ